MTANTAPPVAAPCPRGPAGNTRRTRRWAPPALAALAGLLIGSAAVALWSDDEQAAGWLRSGYIRFAATPPDPDIHTLLHDGEHAGGTTWAIPGQALVDDLDADGDGTMDDDAAAYRVVMVAAASDAPADLAYTIGGVAGDAADLANLVVQIVRLPSPAPSGAYPCDADTPAADGAVTVYDGPLADASITPRQLIDTAAAPAAAPATLQGRAITRSLREGHDVYCLILTPKPAEPIRTAYKNTATATGTVTSPEGHFDIAASGSWAGVLVDPNRPTLTGADVALAFAPTTTKNR